MSQAPTQQQIEEHVQAMFVELFELDPLKLKTESRLFEDLGLDSLDAIEIAISFQRQFHIRPPNAELMEIRTLGDVYNLVQKYLPKDAQIIPTKTGETDTPAAGSSI
jgi:acyl carrier protein